VSIDKAFGLSAISASGEADPPRLGYCSTRAGPAPSRGKTTASAVSPLPPVVDGAIERATVSLDLTAAPPCGFEASRESNRSPGAIGFSGTSTHSPRPSAVTSPITVSPSRTVTLLPGSARPAMTAVPEGPTLTTSKLGGVVDGCEAGFGIAGSAGTAAGPPCGTDANCRFDSPPGVMLLCWNIRAAAAPSNKTAITDPTRMLRRTIPVTNH
jgi:hypothetical protein